MPESMGKLSDEVGRRNSVTMHKLSIGDSYKHMMQIIYFTFAAGQFIHLKFIQLHQKLGFYLFLLSRL